MNPRDVPIAVVLGGPSAEHDVSLVSGRAIAAALEGLGHPVEGWLVDLDTQWWRLPASGLDRTLPATAYDDPEALGAEGPIRGLAAAEAIAADRPARIVFIALHGPYGEDGTVQALCEGVGLVYTGAGVAASAVAMDKAVFKRVAMGLGLPVVPWHEVRAGQLAAAPDATLAGVADFAASLPDPRLMVKPARLGSSVGMTIVHDPTDRASLRAALEEAFRFDDRALAEAYVGDARELEVSVVGNDPSDVVAYGPGEIFPGHEFYDYVAKYAEGVSRTDPAATLDAAVRERIRGIARTAYLAIGAEGFARVDFLLRGDSIYLNEINTIPGFTPISLFPLMCGEGGLDFAGISERIVELALERAERRNVHRLTRGDLP